MADGKEFFDMLAVMLVIIGALNWGLVGVLDFNLVTTLLGDGTATRVVYTLVGLSGLYIIFPIWDMMY